MSLQHSCKSVTTAQAQDGSSCSLVCSFVEIYNESLSDLLCPSSSHALAIREDAVHGVYVEHLTSERVSNGVWGNPFACPKIIGGPYMKLYLLLLAAPWC